MLAGEFANVKLSNAPIDLLVDALTRSRSRETALRYLAETAHGRLSALSAYAQSQDPQVRAAIADVIGRSGERDPEALAILQRLHQDADPGVSRAATRALARLGTAVQPVP
jgi:HEAT repeat protein